MYKKKSLYVVFHTTESGADYKVSKGFKTRQDAIDWEFSNRDNYPRPLFIKKISY